jgi:ribosomal protein S4
MGYPGKNHKQYEKPTRKYEKQRQVDEVKLIVTFGLRNKREVWKSQMVLRRFRRAARDITAMSSAGVEPKAVETKKRQMLGHLERMGLVGADAGIETVRHPRPHHGGREEGDHPRLPGEPRRGGADLLCLLLPDRERGPP